MTTASTKQLSVLVVEDEENIRTLLEHFLTREGFEVDLAVDGRSVHGYMDQNEPADLMVLDNYLPYQDGFELIPQIRDHPTWCNVPIMMLTAKSTDEAVERALELGADDYVEKPFSIKKVLARIRRLIST